MIFLINNLTYICLPIYIINEQKFLKFPFFLVIFLEFLLNLIAVYFVVKCIYLVITIRTFHKNLTILLVIFAIQWFEVIFANLLIKPYEIGYKSLNGTADKDNQVIKQFYTFDKDQIIKIPSNSTDKLPNFWFFFGGFLKWHFAISMTTVLFSTSIERLFACYFLNDYEKKSRTYLSILIIGTFQTYNFALSYAILFNYVGFPAIFIFVAVPNLASGLLILYFRSYNLRVTRTIENFSNPKNYTLAARFQAKENIKCFQMMYKMIIAGFLNIVFTCGIVALMVFEVFPNLDYFFNALFQEMFNSFGPLAICNSMIYSVDSWRRFKFLELFRRRNGKTVKIVIAPLHNIKKQSLKVESDTYFQQLSVSWN